MKSSSLSKSNSDKKFINKNEYNTKEVEYSIEDDSGDPTDSNTSSDKEEKKISNSD